MFKPQFKSCSKVMLAAKLFWRPHCKALFHRVSSHSERMCNGFGPVNNFKTLVYSAGLSRWECSCHYIFSPRNVPVYKLKIYGQISPKWQITVLRCVCAQVRECIMVWELGKWDQICSVSSSVAWNRWSKQLTSFLSFTINPKQFLIIMYITEGQVDMFGTEIHIVSHL